MKLVLLCLLLSFFKPAFAQEWPWFFSETAFQKWLSDKNIKCLKYVSSDQPYTYIKATASRSTNKGMATYYFDEEGSLDFVRIEEFEIILHYDSLMTEDNYYIILDELFPSMPWPMQESDKIKFHEYNESKFFPGIRYKFMNNAISPDGKIFAEENYVEHLKVPFPFSYQYRLNQEIYLEKGEISSVKNYDLRGDFYIPNMGIIKYEEINDSVSVLLEKSHITFYTDHGDYIGKDTIFNYPFYRKISVDKKSLEFGVRILDDAGIYNYFPLRKIITDVGSNDKIQIVSQATDYRQAVTPFNQDEWQIFGYRYHNNGWMVRVTEALYRWRTENFLNGSIGYETKKTISETDKKTGEILEKRIYVLSNDEWKLTMSEVKLKSGYLQKYFFNGKKNYSHSVKINIDENSNPIFLKETNNELQVIFRISADSIYLTDKENEWGTFLIEYK